MNLDQTVINWAIGLLGTLGGALLKATWDAIKDLRTDNAALTRQIGELVEKIGREYVRRDDYRDDMMEIKGLLSRIYDKLDDKQDKL